MSGIHLGCAGWSLPRQYWGEFAQQGSQLQRYASVLPACEINSSFYRPHRPATYARWAESVPDDFRFCLKLPRTISHERRLVDCKGELQAFLQQSEPLGARLGCLLLQLPPSLQYQADEAEAFFVQLRGLFAGALALEPRHASWLEAEPLLQRYRLARVAADPSPIPDGNRPQGYAGLRYYRLHGSPQIYRSAYGEAFLKTLAAQLLADKQAGCDVWCIFDNTASGAALGDALLLRKLVAD
jgi:uncharacterized protein YecE (DUF72 family)